MATVLPPQEPTTGHFFSLLGLLVMELVMAFLVVAGASIQSLIVVAETKRPAFGVITLAFCVMCGLAGAEHVRQMLVRFLFPRGKIGDKNGPADPGQG